MKNLVLIILGMICLSLTMPSCGPSKAEMAEKARQDSIRTADSLAAVKKEKARQDSIKAAFKAAIKDSIEWVNFTTPDLRTFNLHGHVKRVVEPIYSNGDNYCCERPNLSFTKNGKAIISAEYYVVRDNDGRISLIKEKANSEGEAYTYDYNRQGKVTHYSAAFSPYHIYEKRYTYDSSGNIKSYSEENIQGTFYDSYQITYLAFDKFGNWTKAKIKPLKTTEGEGTQLVTRTITYYDREKK